MPIKKLLIKLDDFNWRFFLCNGFLLCLWCIIASTSGNCGCRKKNSHHDICNLFHLLGCYLIKHVFYGALLQDLQ